METAQEWLLLIKTTAENFALVRDTIKELHSYELPECIEIAVHAGSEEYLKWIDESVGQKVSPRRRGEEQPER